MEERDSRLDTAKGMLIALVVLGHLFEATTYWNNELIRFELTAIYAFHMPAFVFLAGMTSSADKFVKRIAVMAVLLIVFQGLYYLYLPMTGSNKEFQWLDPFWMLWFLLGMIWWLIILKLLHSWPRTALVLSIVVGIGAGTIESLGQIPSVERALFFLPWFILGYAAGDRILNFATAAPKPVKYALVLASLVVATLFWYAKLGPGWLYGSNSFAVLEVSTTHGILMRSILLCSAGVMTLALLAFTSKPFFFVKPGKRSLAIYLLHGFIVLPLTGPLGRILESHGALVASLACIGATLVIIYVLALPILDRSIRSLGTRGATLFLTAIRGRR